MANVCKFSILHFLQILYLLSRQSSISCAHLNVELNSIYGFCFAPTILEKESSQFFTGWTWSYSTHFLSYLFTELVLTLHVQVRDVDFKPFLSYHTSHCHVFSVVAQLTFSHFYHLYFARVLHTYSFSYFYGLCAYCLGLSPRRCAYFIELTSSHQWIKAVLPKYAWTENSHFSHQAYLLVFYNLSECLVSQSW